MKNKSFCSSLFMALTHISQTEKYNEWHMQSLQRVKNERHRKINISTFSKRKQMKLNFKKAKNCRLFTLLPVPQNVNIDENEEKIAKVSRFALSTTATKDAWIFSCWSFELLGRYYRASNDLERGQSQWDEKKYWTCYFWRFSRPLCSCVFARRALMFYIKKSQRKLNGKI